MNSLQRCIAKADGYELLGVAWAFPTEDVAVALLDGSLAADAQAILDELDVPAAKSRAALKALHDAAREAAGLADSGACEDARASRKSVTASGKSASQQALFEALRHGYTRVFLTPGGRTPVFPYESAFLFAEAGTPGIPTLFRSRTTVDVEACMKDAGVLVKNARKEPADAIWNECAYLAYLYGAEAQALQEEDAAAAARWENHIERFQERHGAHWLRRFMERTRAYGAENPLAAPYGALAGVSIVLLDAMKS